MLETSAGRVPSHTPLDVNLEIKQTRRASIEHFTEHPSAIPDRLRDLDREWDVERTLAAISSGLSLLGLGLGWSGKKRRWIFLPLVVQGFYMQHTLQGWCPPLPLLRRMGFRTAQEIERERCALKDVLREDNAERTQPETRQPLEEAAAVPSAMAPAQ